jgi:hypothetical protein
MLTTLSTSATYRLIMRDLDRSLERAAAEAPVALETRYYLDRIGNVKSIDDLIGDRRLFAFAMKAFGLEDMTYARAFMRKILTEGIADPKSFANRLADDRFIEFAKTFNFAALGEVTTAGSDARQGVADRYLRQTLEAEAGDDNQGVRLALYFQRKAGDVTSVYDLLADPALWQVMKTAYGFPTEMANADIEKQAAAVLAQVPIADLKDPAKLDRLIARFAAAWDATQAVTNDPTLLLFADRSTAQSVDLDLIMTLTSLKHGGP